MISLEDDPTPIVRILGVTLRRAADDPKLAKVLGGMRGRVALRSTTDPQAATITFDAGSVRVDHGVDSRADIVISADLNTMGRPGAPKPKVRGAAKHPKLALGVSKVLDPPAVGGWRGAASEFWSCAADRPERPEGVRVVCTDEGGDVVLGDPDRIAAELHGPAWALTSVFTGGDHLAAAVLEGRLQMTADLGTLNHLVALVSARMFGEL